MTKKRFTEMFQEAMASSELTDDQLGKFDPDLIATYISAGYQGAVNQLYARRDQSNSIEDFTFIERGVKVVNGELRLTKSPMSMKDSDGIRAVYPKGKPGSALTFRATAQRFIMDDMLSGSEHGYYDYSGSTVYIDDCKDVKEFDVAIVPEFWSLEDDDQVPMPRGFESQLIQIVKDIVFNTGPKDLINDSI